jgi:hypothetical protein
MSKGRMEAFSDGVIAIIITVMVLELRVPHGADLAALRPLIPVFLSYVLSFVFLGIYWSNHHHAASHDPAPRGSHVGNPADWTILRVEYPGAAAEDSAGVLGHGRHYQAQVHPV